MEYLYLIFVLLGIVLDRYIFPLFDILLEFINYWISKLCNGLSLQTQREQLKFEKEVGSIEEKTPAIGFHYEKEPDYGDLEDYEGYLKDFKSKWFNVKKVK